MKHCTVVTHAKKILTAVLLIGLVACTTPSPTSTPAAAPSDITAENSIYAQPGVFGVTETYEVWHDEDRGRQIRVKLYKPAIDTPPPVVIFSHGLGGSVEAAPYLGKQLASWGFLAIHMQHPGSDGDVWAGLKGRRAIFGALKSAAGNPNNAVDRYNDIPFVLDEIERRSTSEALHADPNRMALAGHSFGAHTVLALAGRQYITAGEAVSFKDDRLLAGVVLSPPSPSKRITQADYAFTYGAIDLPLLHVTGTEDANPLDASDAAENRQIPFSQITKAKQYLMVFEGADHAVFGGAAGRRRSPDWYPKVQAQVAGAATAFFLAYVTQDTEAQIFMDGPSFSGAFEADVAIERH